MEKLTLLKELLRRLSTESPDFFKKIKNYSLYVAILIGVALAGEWLEIYVLPGKLSSVLWAVLTYFLGTGTTAALPTKNPEDLTESKYKL